MRHFPKGSFPGYDCPIFGQIGRGRELLSLKICPLSWLLLQGREDESARTKE
jgi:hypothetical protein